MTGNYTFKTLYQQIKTQKSDFWHTSLYGIVATLLLLSIPMLIPLLFGSTVVWVYIAVILALVLILGFVAFFQ